jgi:hypothetical protein
LKPSQRLENQRRESNDILGSVALSSNDEYRYRQARLVMLSRKPLVKTEHRVKVLIRGFRKQLPVPDSLPSEISDRKDLVPRKCGPQSMRNIFIEK